MTNRRILAAILTELSKATSKCFDAHSFKSRLRIQKSIYLLRALGVPEVKGYAFSHYVRGPYSPSLAKDYYALKTTPVLPKKVKLSESQLKIMKECIKKGDAFLEAVSTLHSVAMSNKNHSEEEIINHVRDLKPHLNFCLKEAWRFLRTHGLVKD